MLKYEITRTAEKSVAMKIPGGSSLSLPKGKSQNVWLNVAQADACSNTAGYAVKEIKVEAPPEEDTPETIEVEVEHVEFVAPAPTTDAEFLSGSERVKTKKGRKS